MKKDPGHMALFWLRVAILFVLFLVLSFLQGCPGAN